MTSSFLNISPRISCILFILVSCRGIGASYATNKILLKMDGIISRTVGTEVVLTSSCTTCLRKCATTGCISIAMKIDKSPAQCSCVPLIPTGTWQIFRSEDCAMYPASFMLVHRREGGVDFSQNWEAYKAGFGDTDGDFWFGLEKTHQYTTACSYNLTVDMEDWDGNAYQAAYSHFSVGPETDNYRLSVSGYDAATSESDSLTTGIIYGNHDQMEFTTLDRDNDIWDSTASPYYGNCPSKFNAGWWYTNCMYSHPTGPYYTGGVVERDGVLWHGTPAGDKYSFKIMKYTLTKI